MDWWQVAAAASYPAGVLVEKCAGLVGAHTLQASWLGPQVLDGRFGCEVCFGIRPRLLASLHQLDRSSNKCCLDGGFSLTVVLLCKVFCE